MTNKQAQITINAIKFMLDNAQYSEDVEEALNMAINALTTQPETHDKRTETHACDLIDRHDAIYELYEKYHGMISDESMKIYKIIEWLKSLPSAQQERKKGKWTKAYDGNDDHVKCTGCFKTYDWISQAQYYNYCPNCGADLRGEQDD